VKHDSKKPDNTTLPESEPHIEIDAEGGRFDMTSLVASTDDMELAPGELVVARVEISKPSRGVFFRVRPMPYSWYYAVVTDADEWYLLVPKLVPDVPEAKRIILYQVATRPGSFFLWPVPGPDLETGVIHSAHAAKHAAARLAQARWISIIWRGARRAFEVRQATAAIPDPRWPELTYEELLRKAFGDRIIKDPEHPVLQQLLGSM